MVHRIVNPDRCMVRSSEMRQASSYVRQLGTAACLLLTMVGFQVSPVKAALLSLVAPYVEQLDAARWPDLTEEHRRRLIEGALDAFDREASPVVRALALRMLTLIAVLEPGRLLPVLEQRSGSVRSLLDETSSDTAAASLAIEAYAAWFALAPDRVPWLEPPAAYRAVAVVALR